MTLTAQFAANGWRELEIANHRLFYSLVLKTSAEDPKQSLILNFLADNPANGHKVTTGHDSGVITVALTKPEGIERERRRLKMNEPYRTLLGQFRHEVGLYFWDILSTTAASLRPVVRSSEMTG